MDKNQPMLSETSSSAALPPQQPQRFDESLWRAAWTKATFLGFCWLSYFLFVVLCALAFYLMGPRLTEISSWLNRGVLMFLGALCLIPGAGLFLISATALSGIDLLYPHRSRSITVKLLFPIAATMSQIFGVSRSRLRTSFVKVNNALTKAQRKRIRGEKIMILLPHCLQIDVCNRKLTSDVKNCARCGKCTVGELLALGDKYGLLLEVVNGGTAARKRVATFRPDGIVAVACERDLTFGIQDVYPIPVYGVINDRPYGPCHNTCVDMEMVEEAVKFFRKTNTSTQGA